MASQYMGMQGKQYLPDERVGIFVWKNQWPWLEATAPFNAIMQRLLGGIARHHNMLNNDGQADWERSHGTMMVQALPQRTDKQKQERKMITLLFSQFLCDPSGHMPGNAPGGLTMNRENQRAQHTRASSRLISAATRVAGNNYHGRADAIQTQVDPCTGMLERKFRTLPYQRGILSLPDGMQATTASPQAQLRPDLLAQSNHWMSLAAITIGVPPSFVMGTSGTAAAASGGRSSRWAAGGTGSVGGVSAAMKRRTQAGAGTSDGPGSATSQMRLLVRNIRRELDVFVDETFGELVRLRRIADLSEEMQQIDHQDQEAMQYMDRQLELMGDILARDFRDSRDIQRENTSTLHRAVAIASRAELLWKTDFIRQRVALIRGYVPSAAGPSLSHAALAHPTGRELGEQRTRGLDVAPAEFPGEVLAPGDDGDPMRKASSSSTVTTTTTTTTSQPGKKRKRRRARRGSPRKGRKRNANQTPTQTNWLKTPWSDGTKFWSKLGVCLGVRGSLCRAHQILEHRRNA